MNDKSTTLLLVAGGKGIRMGSAVPKQFLPLLDKPLIYYPIQIFLDTFPDGKIVLVLPKAHFSYANILLQAFNGNIELTIVAGGETRFHSVSNGLKEIEDGIVFIHDGVRPFIDKKLLTDCFGAALEHGNAIPATAVTDSIRQWDGTAFKAIDRSHLRSMQTPQTFDVKLIKKAFEQEYNDVFTDEATMLEHMGVPINLIEGSRSNIKITTPEDMIMAEALMQLQNNSTI
ncbi:2-C-methyl-D-erythritol 4-phosphate cytidylyltransferase [Taibaiella lutea]|nr:2-C-methyl-D-erythritol 4-phosphate cytidylyltransferase [Taibaiella lutea]